MSKAALLILALSTCMVGWPAPAPASNGDPSLIDELGLREAAAPVRESPRWRKPMRIVIDGGVPGLAETIRDANSDLKFVVASPGEPLLAAIAGADVFVGRQAVICNERMLQAARELRWIQVLSAGVEFCARQAALAQQGILLTNMRAVSSPVIAEHAIAMLLGLARGMHWWLPAQQRQEWISDLTGKPMVSVSGKTLLVVGLGGIGSETARRGKALGMRVIATRARPGNRPDYVDYLGGADELPKLLPQADAIVNALPLVTDTAKVFDQRLFERAKRGAFFINVGRGGTVDTAALVAALQTGQLGGAGLDVTDPEPLPREHALWQAPNVIISPHIAAGSDLGDRQVFRVLQENLRRYQAGEKMLSVVDLARGY